MALGDTLIEVSGVAKHFGEGETRVDALRAVDLTVRAGEVVALLGPSGSGKTTLLNIIGCILAPSAGRVALDGEPGFYGGWVRRAPRRLRVRARRFLNNLRQLAHRPDRLVEQGDIVGRRRHGAFRQRLSIGWKLRASDRTASASGRCFSASFMNSVMR